MITFEPIQAGSGDPSPSNIRAISGYDKIEVLSCGKNLFGGVYNESYSLFIPKGTTITVSIKQHENPYTIVNYYDKNGTQIDYWGLTVASATSENRLRRTFTLSDDAYSFKFDTAPCEDMQIEIGTYDSEYVPYHKTTDISELLPQTVYGGNLDVRTGKLTILDKIIDMGDISWTYDSQYQRFVTNLSDMKLVTEPRTERAWFSCYECITDGRPFSEVTNGQAYIVDPHYLYIHNSDYSTAYSFGTAMAGQKIVYPLETPIEIQLTPHEISLLKDYAYVSTNGTSMSFDYHNGEIATLGDVAQLSATVEEFTSKFVTVFGTTGDTVNVEKMIPFPDGVDGTKLIYLGFIAKNSSNNIWYSNTSTITIFTSSASGYGFRVTATNSNYLNQPIKIFGVLVP